MNIKDKFYKNHNKIEVPICFYENDNGNKVYDLEAMTEEFENELSNIVGVTIMCTILQDQD